MLSAVDLLVLTRLDQILFKTENIIYLFTKQATLMRRSIALNFPLQLVFPAPNIRLGCKSVPGTKILLVVPKEQHTFKNVSNCLNATIYSYLETSGGQSSNPHLNAVHFLTLELNRNLWQLNTAVFQHW